MNTNRPKVSVIVPIYNVEKYIERCARSLFEQTLCEIEYIFINDCSPDDSLKILRNLLEDYPHRRNNVIILEQDANKGVAAARQLGISKATGRYIAHCDSDDWVSSDAYEILYNTAIKEAADCVICNCYRSTNGISKEFVYQFNNKGQLLRDLLTTKKGGALWTFFAQKELYDDIIFPHCHMWEDLAVSLQIAYQATNIANIIKPLYFYYQNPDSVSHVGSLSASLKRMEESANNIALIENFLKSKDIINEYDYELVLLKYYSKHFIANYTNKNNIRKIWRQHYKDINKTIICSNAYPAKIRVKMILMHYGLFPFFYSLKRAIK